jgi:hypothetical protein
MSQSCNKIYGIDTDKEVTEIMVRDAIIKCFQGAHKEELDEMKEFHDFESEEEFGKMKKLNVKMLITKFITDEGGDFDNPSKNNLVKLVAKLEEYAQNFRNPDVIAKHKDEIALLINKL